MSLVTLASFAGQVVLAAEISAFHPSAEAALDQAHRLLTGKFLGPEGLLFDYLGEIPTPQDCAEARPNAMGWWSPIENGPMFTGPYLSALCEKVRRGGNAADRATCRKMAAGLLRAASVSSVKGMIVRGFATDGSAHYPLGSEDQTLPWFFGLHAYAQSGIPTAAERAAAVAKMAEVAEALEALDWKCPCDGRFSGESRGNFKKGLPFRGAAHYLFILRAMADVTGSETWLDRYVKACGEKPSDSDLTRLEICARGYETDLGKFGVEPHGLWIYVCAQGCLKALAKMDGDGRRRSSYFAGLKINADRARKFFGEAAKFDNSTEKPFRYANWRTGYAWRDQPTQKIAEAVSGTANGKVLGSRKGIERSQMTTPLSACAIVAYAGREDDRAAIAQVLRHYDYASLNISEFFLAEVAWYALPEPREMRLCEGLEAWGADATADDDGRPRHKAVPSAPKPGCEVFVAPDGDDGAAGTETAPLRTLAAAQARVREMRRKGLPAGGVAVNLRGGTYPVGATLALTADDSGEPGRPVTWRAYRGERPVLDGGFRVTGFVVATAADALARLPKVAHGKVLIADVRAIGAEALVPQTPFGTTAKGADERIMGLYFNGEPLTLARDPNEGWYTVGTCVDVTNRVFRPAGVADLSRWTKDREPELMALGYWTYFWADATTEVDEVDVGKGTVRIRDRGGYTAPKAGQTFRFVNALAALDEPGEWFLDRAAGKLYVWPTAPGGNYVLTRFGGAFVSVKKAHDVRLEGLTLQYGRGAGVTMSDVKSVVFAGNVVRRFGGRGLKAHGVRDTLLVGNVLHTFGHMAVDVTSGDRRTLTPGGLVVANNEIWDPGRAQRTYSPGIQAHGVGIEIVHNHIHDVPSSAIMPGGNDHYVGWNLVERVVTESDDQGGIDMWGDPTWAGTRMCWNVWRDIGGTGQGSFPAGRAGIRLDDAISGMSLYGNRFVNSSKGHFGGVQIHAGRFNRVENNLFVGGVCGVSFTDWGQERWGAYFRRPNVRHWMEKEVNAAAEPFTARYPHLAALASAPMTNVVARNVFAEVERTFRNPPKATAFRGNLCFATAAAAEAAFGKERHLRALPPEGEIGTYADPALDGAHRNDREP